MTDEPEFLILMAILSFLIGVGILTATWWVGGLVLSTLGC